MENHTDEPIRDAESLGEGPSFNPIEESPDSTEEVVSFLREFRSNFPEDSDEYADISMTIAYLEDPEYHVPGEVPTDSEGRPLDPEGGYLYAEDEPRNREEQ